MNWDAIDVEAQSGVEVEEEQVVEAVDILGRGQPDQFEVGELQVLGENCINDLTETLVKGVLVRDHAGVIGLPGVDAGGHDFLDGRPGLFLIISSYASFGMSACP